MMEKSQDLKCPYGNFARFDEQTKPNMKVCKQCGKVFQSMKALCGHMAFHSEKKVAMESESDAEFEGKKKRNKEKGKKYNKISSSKCSLSVSEIDEKEQEEIAMCLMLLSRDYVSCKGGVNLVVVESSKSRSNEMRNNRIDGLKKLNYGSSLDVEMVEEENSDSEYFLDDDPVRETEKGVKIQGYRTELRKESIQENRIGLKTWKNEGKKRTRDLADYDDDDKLVAESYNRIKYGSAYAEVLNTQPKKSTYECCNCKKSFKSFQALGGHRPCYKRINVDDGADRELILESEEYLGNKKGVSQEVRTSKAVKKVRSKKQKGHACPFCDRVFKSGQALGGHKRSHFLGSNVDVSIQSPETKPAVHDLFDLNLPAPQEEDDDDPQFALW